MTSTSNVPTFFARIIGVSKLTVSAQGDGLLPVLHPTARHHARSSTAPARCATATDANGKCIDLEAARNGVKTFLADGSQARPGRARRLPPAAGPTDYGTQNGQPCLQWKSGKPHTDANCIQWTQVQVRNPDSPQNVCLDAAPTSGNNYYGFDA